jgi:hypothetical protein
MLLDCGSWTGALVFQAPGANVTLRAVDSVGHAGTIGGLTVLSLADTDGDQMPDYWESANGLDIRNPADAALDDDRDGLTNLQEFFAGTDPHSAASALRIAEVVSGAAELRVRFTTSVGKKYRLERASCLPGGAWSAVGPEVNGAGGLAEVSDPLDAAAGNRFYRVRLVQ